MAAATATPAGAGPSRTVDQSVFPVTGATFGTDSFQNATWSVPLLYDCGWDVMGLNKVQWQGVEKSPPVGGVHTYEWPDLDANVRMIADGGKRMELWISPGSKWGTEQWPGPDPQYQSPPKPEHMDDFGLFVRALVERYDGDGTDDMPGLDYPVIYMVRIGGEVEVYGHWEEYGGTAEKYFTMLEAAFLGAKAACPDVLVARAGINFGDLGNDHPDPLTFESRIPDEAAPYVDGTIENQAFFDVMDLHPSGKYTGALAFVEYFRDHLSLDKIYCSDDTNTSPRNGNGDWSYCPLTFVDEDESGVEDIIEDLERNNPGDPIYEAARADYYPDHAGTLIKRFVFHLMSGVHNSFVQPVMDGIVWAEVIWRHAGLLDWVIHYETGDPYQTRKQAYWEYRWLYTKLLGVTAGAILVEEETSGTFFPLTCVYELTRESGDPLWVMWHDYTVDEDHPEHREPFIYTLSTSASQVRVHYTIERWDQEIPDSEVLDGVGGEVRLSLTDRPIIVEVETGQVPPWCGFPAPAAGITGPAALIGLFLLIMSLGAAQAWNRTDPER